MCCKKRRKPRRPVFPTLLLGLAVAASATAADRAWDVVMSNGQVTAARSRPVIALGRVTFVDDAGHQRSFPASFVDLPATRARMAARDPRRHLPRVWSHETLASAGHGVQVLGTVEAASPTSDRAGRAHDARVRELRAELAALDAKLSGGGDDSSEPRRARRIVVLRELQALLQPEPAPASTGEVARPPL